MRSIGLLLAIVSLVAIGCGDGQSRQDMPTSGSSTGEASPPAPSAMPPTDSKQPGTPSGIPSGIPQTDTNAQPGAVRQIVRSGEITLTVDVLDSAERSFRRIVASTGGYTAGSSRQRL